MTSVTVVDHPLVATRLSILRATTTGPNEFRRNLREISVLLLSEMAREWETSSIEIASPLGRCGGRTLRDPIVIVPILRAGLAMSDEISRFLPEAAVGHIGAFRNETTLQPTTYYCRLPPGLDQAQVVLLDPMLATGNSACEAIALLKSHGAARIQLGCVIACPAGIEQIQAKHADVRIIAAAIDPVLNKLGYIVPGLGDAGDRYFGTI